MYHKIDYKRFIECEEEKEVHWQGSDILQLTDYSEIIAKEKARHFCENEVCQKRLKEKGINAQIKYTFWNNVDDFPLSFQPSELPEFWMTAHPTREDEYGVGIFRSLARIFPKYKFHIYGIKDFNDSNLIFHGIIPDEQFNREIKKYQGAIRYNTFDGFSEVLSKACLLGQYAISTIAYPHIARLKSSQGLYKFIEGVAKKQKPNLKARNYYLKELK